MRDVYLPEPGGVLLELHGDRPVTGTIVGYSDSGAVREAYAVIKVAGVARLLMVPSDRVEPVANGAAPDPFQTQQN